MANSPPFSDRAVYPAAEVDDIPLDNYLRHLVRSLQEELKDNLLAIYLFGSAGYGAYEPGTSDVDVYAIIHEPILDYQRLSRIISHTTIPCPARKLEFVLFTKAKAASQMTNPAFEMNFNTGKDMNDYVNLNSQTEPRFWFLLDIAIGRDLGKSLLGPPPDKLFAAPKVAWILNCMVESLAWYRQNGPVTYDGVLNACRQLCYAKTLTWRSKMDSGTWVLDHCNQPKIVTLAMHARTSKAALPQDLALEFFTIVENELEQRRGN
ncbi:uncharacterized protein N7500_004710 [Penicillium coprophilum]|uniref:uncharacterized protein n=1 Tax=Penicillium coprophilum TaxID=36646 RepID=UPI00239575AE|nr:uncharacterized protein N7500_004710 [Penicillium coprophilum]KAJ5162880.1 hypothetical protein N7500_004710 [Penicillium coprophilum]